MRVAVFGAGVAGLTAAHELIDRGADVDVYDKLPIAGGKARSIVIEREGQEGYPAEHGFRFFPGFYKHLINTMERIPRPGGGSVAENLVAAPTSLMAQAGFPPVEMRTVGPTSLRDIEKGLRAIRGIERIVPVDDVDHFAGKLWQIMTSCRARRLAEYENISWSEFINAASRSEAYRQWFAGAATRTLLAASGRKASSRTVGDITTTLLAGGWVPGKANDRLLNAPTNDAWIGPWVSLLESSGRFTFHPHHTMTRLDVDLATARIRGIEVERTTGGEGDGHSGERETITADAYVIALPVEVIAELVDEELADQAPTLALTRLLASDVQCMAGMQIYLKRDVEIVKGHVAYVAAPWALTSVSQQQFWPDTSLFGISDGRVSGVISIDISDWNAPGTNGKAAKDCTPEEVCQEVLAQMRACLGDEPDFDAERDLGPDNVDSFFIDPDIVFFGHGGVERNDEPLLVNRLGTWWIRPNAYTELDNLFICGDYVRTATDLATMEGANEAARRAVNAMIGEGLVDGDLCRLWPMHEPGFLAPFRWLDARRFAQGKPWRSDFPRWLGWLARIAGRVEHWLERRRARSS